jgi:deoxyuridine 5'-triphosphate nucleotidohydrolase
LHLLNPVFVVFRFCAAPRSGLAVKNFIDVGAGVVDYDYRGNVGVVLFNHGEQDFAIARGDRVAQLILERICMAPAVEVQELSDTARGSGGFGSTGVQLAPPAN